MSRRRKHKRKSRKLIYGVIVVALVFFCVLSYSFLYRPNQTNESNGNQLALKAAIVDHLSLTAPNQIFIQTATNTLETANYTVDYYPCEEVNVEFYRNLPTHGYDLIVLRVHSSFTDKSVCLFTSERYSLNKHEYEQLIDRVGAVAFSREEAEKGIMYFGVMPSFVQYSMKQTFNNTIIIVMGCDGLMYTPMAEAFIEKGAKVYVSWNGPVSASHTDQATTQLLQYLIAEKQTIKQAVTETMKEVGPDPEYKSILEYYSDT